MNTIWKICSVICITSFLTGCGQPFSDEELLNRYFDLPYSDFKDAHTYYDEGFEILNVYFKFKMNGEAAQKRMQAYIDKYFYPINKTEFENEYFKGPVALKWWDPEVKEKNTFFRSRYMKGKMVDEGLLLIHKDSKTIYVRLFHVFSDPKTQKDKKQ